MTQEEFDKLWQKVGDHENSLNDQMTEIETLRRKVSDLSALAQHLFVLCSSVQRTSEQQENAFNEATKLLNPSAGPETL
jgi:hypothetical protein